MGMRRNSFQPVSTSGNIYKMKLSLILTVLISVCYQSLPGQAILEGNAPQFANEVLFVRQITNPFTGHSTIIDTLEFDSTGTFHDSIPVQETSWIFINSGLFRITMMLQKEHGYDISLPPKTKKSEADIRNPFFKPVIAHIQVREEFRLDAPGEVYTGNDINTRIFRFDTLISARNQDILQARRLNRQYNSDSLIRKIESHFKKDTSSYFRDYRKYRYGLVRINSRDVGLRYIYDHFLGPGTPPTDNPAYYELFNEMFDEFLFYFSRTPEGKSVNYLVNRAQDARALNDTIMKHPAVPSAGIAEMIILKGIFDIYHQNYYYKEALLRILDTIIAAPVEEIHAEWASGIKQELIKLKIGQKPPDFNLLDAKNVNRTLEDFRGKYVYLDFCTPDNYSCLKEFPFLKAIHDVHQEYLEIVTVMVTEKRQTMTDFMERNDYNWTALFYGNDESLLSNYNVRAYPTSYLIDPEGKLIQSPAPLATEGLEEQLFKIMRARGDL